MISLNGYPFQPAALALAVDQAQREIQPGDRWLLKAAVDHDGVRVFLVFSKEGGDLKFETAFQHDWTGSNRFAVSGSYSF